MSKLLWDVESERYFETGLSKGVLYLKNDDHIIFYRNPLVAETIKGTWANQSFDIPLDSDITKIIISWDNIFTDSGNIPLNKIRVNYMQGSTELSNFWVTVTPSRLVVPDNTDHIVLQVYTNNGSGDNTIIMYDRFTIDTNRSLYSNGIAWNGLLEVTEKEENNDPVHVYSDDTPYTDIFEPCAIEASLKAYMYPEEFEACIGIYTNGAVSISNQEKKRFGLCYRTEVGNVPDGVDHGYKIHILYDCVALPSDITYSSINESPSLTELSWDIKTYPMTMNDKKLTSMITVDSRKTSSSAMKKIESYLYGSSTQEPTLLLPDTVNEIVNTSYLIEDDDEFNALVFGDTRILVN